MKGLLITFLLASSCILNIQNTYAQIQLQFLFRIDTPATYITIDNFDNIYAVTAKNQLLKYNSSGKLLWNYSNKAFGKLTYVDATDPMRILLFYAALQQAVVLNNNLNEINRFNFSSDASQQISLMATANSNGYWVFDQLNRQLQKLGNQFTSQTLSGDIFQQTQKAVQPLFMAANDQFSYLYDNKYGVMQFDRFGTYSRSFNTDTIATFQLKENTIFYTLRNHLKKLNLVDGTLSTDYQFKENVLQASIGNKNLITLTADYIYVYTFVNFGNEKN